MWCSKLSGKKFPQLKRLRDAIGGLYGSIRGTVNDLMKSTSMSDVLTDEYVAQVSRPLGVTLIGLIGF